MEKLRTVRGVHDLLPNDLHNHNKVINAGLDISDKYNYYQIEIPIFEFAEVFTKPLGTSSDIVTKENYIFKDRSEDELMLRPEGTSGVVRAFKCRPSSRCAAALFILWTNVQIRKTAKEGLDNLSNLVLNA